MHVCLLTMHVVHIILFTCLGLVHLPYEENDKFNILVNFLLFLFKRHEYFVN